MRAPAVSESGLEIAHCRRRESSRGLHHVVAGTRQAISDTRVSLNSLCSKRKPARLRSAGARLLELMGHRADLAFGRLGLEQLGHHGLRSLEGALHAPTHRLLEAPSASRWLRMALLI